MNQPLTKQRELIRLKKTSREFKNKRRRFSQTIAFAIIWTLGITAIALLIWIIGYVFIKGFPTINLEFLTTRPAGGFDGEGGISTTIVTTIYLVVFTIILAAPLGIGAAIYFIEYGMK